MEAEDIDADVILDLIATHRGEGRVRCVTWQRRAEAADDWQDLDVGRFDRGKFDLAEPLGLDGDRDLDLITCEEMQDLGIF